MKAVGYIAILLGLGVFLFIGIVFLFNDTVSEYHETYAVAQEKGLFKRGWLPDIIPLSSSKISTENDLDVNTSNGEFYFSAADADAFVAKLSPLAISESLFTDKEKALVDNGYAPYEFTDADYRWIFYVSSDKGHCYFKMRYREKY